MKRPALAWIPILCIVGVIASCSSPSSTTSSSSQTEPAIRQFYDRLAAEDYAAVLGLYTSEVRQALELPEGGVDMTFEEWAQAETQEGRVDHVTVVNETIDAETASVEYDVHYADGSTVKRIVSMKREDGAWKLGFIDEG